LLSSLAVAQSPGATHALEVKQLDDGSVTVDLGYNIKLNKNSTLHRIAYVVNDPLCVVQLSGVGFQTKPGFAGSSEGYRFVSTGDAIPTEAISVVEIRSVIFDVFGNHITTLSNTDIADHAKNDVISLRTNGAWYGTGTEVTRFLTSVTFVARVRKASGVIWRYDAKSVQNELGKIQLSISADDLDPSSTTKK
jgi:hypothetical protein